MLLEWSEFKKQGGSMQEETAAKVYTIATYASRLETAAQEAQYLLAEKQPLPLSLRAVFGAVTSPYDLEDTRHRYSALRVLTYCLQTHNREPEVARLYLAYSEPTRFQGKDIKDLFNAFADELMALPENKPEPELRKLVEPTVGELSDMAEDLKIIGCTMNGTVISKLPPMPG